MAIQYATSGGSALELRKPVMLFMPLAWLVAGPLNPAGFYAYHAWGLHFDIVQWAIFVAIPLALGVAATLFYLSGGGFGFSTLAIATVVVSIGACSVAAPIFTLVLWALDQTGIYRSYLPLNSYAGAIGVTGTFIRTGLLLVAVPVFPAVLILRLLAFQREPAGRR